MAYQLSLLTNFIKGIHRPYEIDVDGQKFSGDYTLMCVCNGRWYGGSFNPSPDAQPDDGVLDFLVVNAVSRLTVAKVVNHYAQGKAKDYPEFITCLRGHEMRVRCDRESRVNVDGEEIRATDIIFRISDRKLRFFYPKQLNWTPLSKLEYDSNSSKTRAISAM
jgi:diacylglycerol kinase family enzyme